MKNVLICIPTCVNDNALAEALSLENGSKYAEVGPAMSQPEELSQGPQLIRKQRGGNGHALSSGVKFETRHSQFTKYI